MNRAIAVLLVLACACDEPAAPVPQPPARRAVARERLAECEREVGPLETPPPAAADLADHVQGLLETIAGSDEAMRRLARTELAELGSATVPELDRRLYDSASSAEQRSAAIAALAELDSPLAATKLLARIEWMRANKDLEPWVRAHCAWRLGATAQDWVVPRLILHLRYEADRETTRWIATTLAHFDNFSGLDALYVQWQDESDPTTREAAGQTLVNLATERGAANSDELLRAWNAGELGPRDPAALPSPRRRLEVWRIIAGFSEWQLRGVDDGRFTLARECSFIAPLLAEALDDENRYVRTHAAQTLERMGRRARAAGPALLAALADAEIAAQVLETLGAVGHAPAEPELAARLAPTSPLDLRVAAARGLRSLALPASVPALERCSAPTEPLELRIYAAAARVHCSPTDTPRALVELLLDDLSTGAVENATPENALAAWLLARSTSSDAAKSVWTDWLAVTSDDPRDRVSQRARLLRESLPKLF